MLMAAKQVWILLLNDGGIEQSGNFDMDIWDDGYSGNDPSDFLWGYYYSDAAIPDYGYNYGRYINPQVDELIDNSYTLDETERQEYFCQMADILSHDLPELLLFTTVDANTHSARLQGVISNANEIVTWNCADWTLQQQECNQKNNQVGLTEEMWATMQSEDFCKQSH